jgi:ferric-dicitrate binding protein FerR (iron transport regulator)
VTRPTRRADRPAAAPPRRRTLARAALGLVGLGAVALAALGYARWAEPVVVRATPATTAAVTLPDGSEVTLASDSRLTYRRGFGRLLGAPAERRVTLRGEAFFDVQTGDAPFVVETFNAEVEVLGTRFNVRARAEEATDVALEEGRVRVSAGGAAVELASGEATQVPAAGLGGSGRPLVARPSPPASVALGRALAWQAGGLSLDDLSLRAAFAEIERRYGIEVEAPGVDLRAAVTAYYAERPELRTVLGDLCAAHGLRYRLTSRGAEILPGARTAPATASADTPPPPPAAAPR